MYSEPSQWTITEKLARELKVKMYYSSDQSNETQKYLYFSRDYNESKTGIFPLDITGYDTLYNFPITGKMKLTVDTETQKIILKENDQLVEEFDISEFLESLYNIYKSSSSAIVSMEDLTLSISGKNYDAKIYFEYISLLNPDYTGSDTTSSYDNGSNGYLLLREK